MRRPLYRRPPARQAARIPSQGKRKVARCLGWQRQAESSELGDGGFPVRRTIAKAFGLDAATRRTLSIYPHSGLCDCPDTLLPAPIRTRSEFRVYAGQTSLPRPKAGRIGFVSHSRRRTGRLESWNSGILGIRRSARLFEIGFVCATGSGNGRGGSTGIGFVSHAWFRRRPGGAKLGLFCTIGIVSEIGFVFRRPWLTQISHNPIPGRQLPSIYLPPKLALFRTIGPERPEVANRPLPLALRVHSTI